MIAWLRQHRDALVLALRRLASAPANTLLSLLAIGVALSLPAGGHMLFANVQSVMGKVSAKPQVSVFMALDADRKSAEDVAARVKRMEGVESATLVTREETLRRMKAQAGIGEVIEALPGNPFPDAIAINPRNEAPEALERLAAELRKVPKVEHVQLDSAWVQRLDALLRLGRMAVMLLALLLAAGLVAITFSAIRLQVATSRAEIEVSRLLGATEAFIRRPYYYFGALQGLLGGAIAWAIVRAAAAWLSAPIAELAGLYRLEFTLVPPAGVDAAVLLLLATTLGWAGAALSLRKA
jgi:cell division transport system permease protein